MNVLFKEASHIKEKCQKLNYDVKASSKMPKSFECFLIMLSVILVLTAFYYPNNIGIYF